MFTLSSHVSFLVVSLYYFVNKALKTVHSIKKYSEHS